MNEHDPAGCTVPGEPHQKDLRGVGQILDPFLYSIAGAFGPANTS